MKNYTIQQADNVSRLAEICEKMTEFGYTPEGGMTIVPPRNGVSVHYQVMYKPVNPTPCNSCASCETPCSEPETLRIMLDKIVDRADMTYPHFEKGEGKEILDQAKALLEDMKG